MRGTARRVRQNFLRRICLKTQKTVHTRSKFFEMGGFSMKWTKWELSLAVGLAVMLLFCAARGTNTLQWWSAAFSPLCDAERRHWRHRGQIEARRAFSVTDGWKIKRAQCARFIFDIALQRSCLHCNFSATKRAFSRRSAPSCKKFSLEKIRKKHQNHTVLMLFGGDKRDRTADLLTASQALSQLSYTPMPFCFSSFR